MTKIKTLRDLSYMLNSLFQFLDSAEPNSWDRWFDMKNINTSDFIDKEKHLLYIYSVCKTISALYNDYLYSYLLNRFVVWEDLIKCKHDIVSKVYFMLIEKHGIKLELFDVLIDLPNISIFPNKTNTWEVDRIFMTRYCVLAQTLFDNFKIVNKCIVTVIKELETTNNIQE